MSSEGSLSAPHPTRGLAEQSLGFVGIGVMGLPMAGNLRDAGFELTVFDIDPSARLEAEARGLRLAGSLPELIRTVDVLILMLPDTPDVERVMRSDGVLAHGRPGLVVVDMSTIAPAASVEFAAELSAAGMRTVDAPVSGGVHKARSGELSIMVGGPEGLVRELQPVWDALGSAQWMGGAGSGQAAKACNQVAIALTIQAACEALALGAKLGLDLEKLLGVLRGGSCASFVLDNLAPLMLAGDDRAGFRIALQVKDLKIAQQAAVATSTPLPGAASVLGLYQQAVNQGQGGDGNQALYRLYERVTGGEIARRPDNPTTQNRKAVNEDVEFLGR